MQCLPREDYTFDFAGHYGCESSVWARGAPPGEGSSSGVTRVQDLRCGDLLPLGRKIALVICLDRNGFERSVLRACRKHLAFSAASPEVSLSPSIAAALVIHRVAHLRRQCLRDRPSLFERLRGIVGGGGGRHGGGGRGSGDAFTYTHSREDAEGLFLGNLDQATALKLRKKWIGHLARNNPTKQALYNKYVERPVQPFGDLRPPEAFRKPRIPPNFSKKNKGPPPGEWEEEG